MLCLSYVNLYPDIQKYLQTNGNKSGNFESYYVLSKFFGVQQPQPDILQTKSLHSTSHLLKPESFIVTYLSNDAIYHLFIHISIQEKCEYRHTKKYHEAGYISTKTSSLLTYLLMLISPIICLYIFLLY